MTTWYLSLARVRQADNLERFTTGASALSIELHSGPAMNRFSFDRLLFVSRWPLPIAILFVIFSSFVGTVAAKKVGEAIVATIDYDTKLGENKVGKVYAGGVYRVIGVNGKWCAVRDISGWIPKQYVLTLDLAMEQYSRRIRDNERDFDALATRAMIHLEKGDLGAAFQDLNNALKINATRPNFWNNRGLVYMRMNQIAPAIRDISYAISLSPNYANAWHNRGMCFYATGELDKSIADYNKAIELQKDIPVYYVNRGVSLHAAGQPAKALEDFDKAISIRDDLSEAYIGRSNVLLGRGDLVRADDNASQAIQLDPNSAEAYNNRGWIRYKAGSIENAMKDFDKSIELDREFSKAFSNRGVLLTEAGKFDLAIADFDAAIKLEEQSALAFMNRGGAWMGKHEYEKARSDFDKALELTPDDSEALNAKAWFLAICTDDSYRDGKKALELAKQACEISGMNDWSHVDTLAAALAETGNFDEAVVVQTKAIELAPNDKKDIGRQRLELYKTGNPFRSDAGKGQLP